MITIDSLKTALLKNAVPVTMEFPGYLCVVFRQAEITIGIDEATIRVQASHEGIDLPVNYARSIYPSTEVVDVIDELIEQLSIDYEIVDTYLKELEEVKTNGHG